MAYQMRIDNALDRGQLQPRRKNIFDLFPDLECGSRAAAFLSADSFIVCFSVFHGLLPCIFLLECGGLPPLFFRSAGILPARSCRGRALARPKLCLL
jgi:hypothetical protein